MQIIKTEQWTLHLSIVTSRLLHNEYILVSTAVIHIVLGTTCMSCKFI